MNANLRFHFAGIALNVSSGYIDPLLNVADYYLAMEDFVGKLVIAQPPFLNHSTAVAHLKTNYNFSERKTKRN